MSQYYIVKDKGQSLFCLYRRKRLYILCIIFFVYRKLVKALLSLIGLGGLNISKNLNSQHSISENTYLHLENIASFLLHLEADRAHLYEPSAAVDAFAYLLN
jgi:hypothetical protein